MAALPRGVQDHGRASYRWGRECLPIEVVDHQAHDRHLLGAGYATTTALVFVPKGLTEPGLLPGGATPHGVLENVLGSAVPAFVVTALVSGKAGVRDLARRSFWWRVPLRWYLISLLAPLLMFLIAVTILYGFAPLRALAQNWLLLLTVFLPALAVMILLNNVAEESAGPDSSSPDSKIVMVRSAPPC
jgi:hypothetical protein